MLIRLEEFVRRVKRGESREGEPKAHNNTFGPQAWSAAASPNQMIAGVELKLLVEVLGFTCLAVLCTL